MKLDEHIITEIKYHAAIESPKECCGVVVVFKGRFIYVKCKNLSQDNDCFIIDPEDYAKAEDMGEPILIVHSHINESALPSQADLVSCERFGVPWLIISLPSETIHTFEPSGYKAPLIGREFSHGILDCYTLIRDYYREELKIELLDFYREELWWEKGQNLYLDNFGKAGFKQVYDGLKKYDIIFMQVESTRSNHAGIYLGEGYMLHHLYGRLSSRDIYGGWYQKVTSGIVRYKDFLK